MPNTFNNPYLNNVPFNTFPQTYPNQFNQTTNPYMNNNFMKQEVVRVNGENGAKAYQLPPNSSILLLDESAPIVWLKVTDGASYPTITGYKITPIEPAGTETVNNDAISSIEERLSTVESNVERILNERKSNYSGNHNRQQSNHASTNSNA